MRIQSFYPIDATDKSKVIINRIQLQGFSLLIFHPFRNYLNLIG